MVLSKFPFNVHTKHTIVFGKSHFKVLKSEYLRRILNEKGKLGLFIQNSMARQK
jgi:hypothetical protein